MFSKISTRKVWNCLIIQVFCLTNQIFGAIRIRYSWDILSDGVKSADARIKRGKYTRNHQGG